LSVMVLTGALMFVLAQLRIAKPLARFAFTAVAGAVIIGFFASLYPQCISRPEGISDQAYNLWFKNVTEVHALYQQGLNDFVTGMALPLSGLIGALSMLVLHRRTASMWMWISIAILSITSVSLLFWQSRAGPAAELLAIPGAVALAWIVMSQLRASGSILLRTFGVVAAFLFFSGLGAKLLINYFPPAPATPRDIAINKAFANCMATSNIAPIAAMPATTIFTFVDMSPRLIATTHHKAVTGPYHRNDDAIVDVHKAFGGPADQAYQIIKRYSASYVLICPMMAESTLHIDRAQKLKPQGFYGNLVNGPVPNWLTPVALPKDSPFKLWRVAQ
jgi:hypothetical protein